MMTRIETVFGAAFVVLFLVVGGVLLFGGGLRTEAAAPVKAASETGQALTNACSCYEIAFDAGAIDKNPERIAYEAGFQSCRKIAGRKGGEAWTAGWKAGGEGKLAGRSCRRFAGL